MSSSPGAINAGVAVEMCVQVMSVGSLGVGRVSGRAHAVRVSAAVEGEGAAGDSLRSVVERTFQGRARLLAGTDKLRLAETNSALRAVSQSRSLQSSSSWRWIQRCGVVVFAARGLLLLFQGLC